jgi:hypothetical protein
MANPPCMSQDGNPAVFVGTMLETGDAVALCDGCLVAWAAALLNVMTGLDPTPFLVAVSDDVPEVVFPDDSVPGEDPGPTVPEPDPPTPIKRAGRTSRASAGPGMDADHDTDAPPSDGGRVAPAA